MAGQVLSDFAEVLYLGLKEFAIVQVLGLKTAAMSHPSGNMKGTMKGIHRNKHESLPESAGKKLKIAILHQELDYSMNPSGSTNQNTYLLKAGYVAV